MLKNINACVASKKVISLSRLKLFKPLDKLLRHFQSKMINVEINRNLYFLLFLIILDN